MQDFAAKVFPGFSFNSKFLRATKIVLDSFAGTDICRPRLNPLTPRTRTQIGAQTADSNSWPAAKPTPNPWSMRMTFVDVTRLLERLRHAAQLRESESFAAMERLHEQSI